MRPVAIRQRTPVASSRAMAGAAAGMGPRHVDDRAVQVEEDRAHAGGVEPRRQQGDVVQGYWPATDDT